jgi:hypothetical protein
VASEKYHAGKQKKRWAEREREREEGTNTAILRLRLGVGNLQTKFYECGTSAEIFRSNIDEVFGQEKLEETNNRKLLSMFLDSVLT